MFKTCCICGSLVDDGGPIGNNYNYWIGIICGCEEQLDGEAYQVIKEALNDPNRSTQDKENFLEATRRLFNRFTKI